MAAVIKPLGKGIVAMMKEGWVAAEMSSRAERVAGTARSIAPVESGAYAESIHVTVETHPERVVAHVGSDVPYAMVVEANHGVLTRALGSA